MESVAEVWGCSWKSWKRLWNITWFSFTQEVSCSGHKTSSRLCEHEPHIFMGCLLAAAGQVGTKADCCSPFSLPALNCNVTCSLKPNICKDTRKAPGYQSLDQETVCLLLLIT
ncbi:uncharacterized protein WM277_004837 [Molossus nigricans]